MLTLFGNKKISSARLANIFINNVIQSVEKGFPDVAAIINESPEFVSCPDVPDEADKAFLLIVLAANLSEIPLHFHDYKDRKLIGNIYAKLTNVFEMDEDSIAKLLKSYESFMKRINHPSRNLIYAMSKAVFYKYNLSSYQDEYFKNMNSPNPTLLKRIDSAMEIFLWDWEAFKGKYTLID